MKTSFYLLFVWNGIEPELIGPFETATARDDAAREKYASEGDEHGYFPQAVKMVGGEAILEVGSYTPAELVIPKPYSLAQVYENLRLFATESDLSHVREVR